MNKSNENVLQLINLWDQNKNSLSISQKSIPEMKRQTTQVSLHQDSDNVPDQFLIQKVDNNFEKFQEIQESQENKSFRISVQKAISNVYKNYESLKIELQSINQFFTQQKNLSEDELFFYILITFENKVSTSTIAFHQQKCSCKVIEFPSK